MRTSSCCRPDLMNSIIITILSQDRADGWNQRSQFSEAQHSFFTLHSFRTAHFFDTFSPGLRGWLHMSKEQLDAKREGLQKSRISRPQFPPPILQSTCPGPGESCNSDIIVSSGNFRTSVSKPHEVPANAPLWPRAAERRTRRGAHPLVADSGVAGVRITHSHVGDAEPRQFQEHPPSQAFPKLIDSDTACLAPVAWAHHRLSGSPLFRALQQAGRALQNIHRSLNFQAKVTGMLVADSSVR